MAIITFRIFCVWVRGEYNSGSVEGGVCSGGRLGGRLGYFVLISGSGRLRLLLVRGCSKSRGR